MIIDFHIPGIPVPKQGSRHRAFIKDGKAVATTYQTKAIKEYEKKVATCARAAIPPGFKPHDGEVHVLALLYAFKPIKSLKAAEKRIIEAGGYVYKITKPDLPDNLPKALFDGMEGVVYTNDSRVCRMNNVDKVYRKNTGIWIRLELK